MLTYKEFVEFIISAGKNSVLDCWDEKKYIWMISRLDQSQAKALIEGMVA